MTKDELRAKANELPLLPGVYLMMDKTGQVIYVGKAIKLKNRVSQYFQDTASHNDKTRRMVSQVDRFDTIIVRTEFEALILENSLIKRHMPRYNILLKDDKGYPFVRLDEKADYPRFTLVTRPAEDGARYFGPFGGRSETRQAIDAVCAALRLPTCSRRFPRDIGKERPCLNHHIGRCDGFCRPDGPDAAEYRRRIAQAVRLFEGRLRQVTAELTAQMTAAAETLDFEQAAALRDRIRALSVLSKNQKVIAGICADTDVWGVYTGPARAGCAVLHIENGDLLGRRVEVLPAAEDDAALLGAVVPQYYLDRELLPREILLPLPVEDMDTLSALLAEAACLDDTRSFFADWTVRHPENDNAELLQHCGPWPISVADEKPSICYPLAFSYPGAVAARAKKGKLTICRFDGDNGEYSLLLGNARGVDGPATKGTYMWVEVDNWPRLEEKIVKGPYIHHCVGIHKDVVPVLYEACRYMGIRCDQRTGFDHRFQLLLCHHPVQPC